MKSQGCHSLPVTYGATLRPGLNKIGMGTCDIKLTMEDSDGAFPSVDGMEAEAAIDHSPSASRALPCVVSKMRFPEAGLSPFLDYFAFEGGWTFTDVCRFGGPILLRNTVFHDGGVFEVLSVSAGAFEECQLRAILISRNVASLGAICFKECHLLVVLAFEGSSHLSEISANTFSQCGSLRSITVPAFVDVLESFCFYFCLSLESVIFEATSRLATIENGVFSFCRSLDRLSIPASVTAIHDPAFGSSGISWIGIEEGSVSFRVVNEFLVDFEVRSLVWVIESPEASVIPSSIEDLRPYCCVSKDNLKTVVFESDSNLRSIGRSAFAECESLESICIPSSIERLPTFCFWSCFNLGTVTFGPESKLRVIEWAAFGHCESLQLVSVPASVEVIGEQPRTRGILEFHRL
jgi:hypothetical protein